MREKELIALLASRLTLDDPRVVLGVGDDAAVLATTDAPLVLSVDAAFEGVHFRRDWASPAELGYRAYVAALSDLAAMGARPLVGLVALGIPDGEGALALEIMEGARHAASRFDAPIVGGNLSRGAELSITSTVVGSAEAGALTRSGGRPGDLLFVSGPLGAAALGWRALAAGLAGDVEAETFVEAWRRPRARLELGRSLVGRASAAIDLSDGLLLDLERLSLASGVGATMELANLPKRANHDRFARRLGEDPDASALEGGEDYELLVALPPSVEPPPSLTRVGWLEATPGVRIQHPDGRLEPSAAGGHDHFVDAEKREG